MERPSEVRQAFRVIGDYIETLERQLEIERGARQRAELKLKAARGPRPRPRPSAPHPTASDNPRHIALEKLGLSGQPTEDEIRRAYRAKAKELHPDGGGSADAFQELTHAMEALLT